MRNKGLFVKYRNICKKDMMTYSCIQHIPNDFSNIFWEKNPVYALYRSLALKYFEQKSCIANIQEYRPRNLVQYSCIKHIFVIALLKRNSQKRHIPKTTPLILFYLYLASFFLISSSIENNQFFVSPVKFQKCWIQEYSIEPSIYFTLTC